MKTVKVKQEFHDKNNFSRIYSVGNVCSFEDERAQDLVDRNLAEFVSGADENIVSGADEKPKKGRKSLDE